MPQTVKQVKERYKIDLHSARIKYDIWRLDDSEYAILRRNSLPLVDCDLDMHYYLSRTYNKSDNLNLAELFTILEWLLGETSNSYDNWKCTFSFPTLLVINKEGGTFFYLMNIYDFRGSIEFKICKIVENPPKEAIDRATLRQPFESEFSKEEIKYFFSYFYGYLEGYFHSAKSIIPKKTFLKTVDSNQLLYGCKDNEYFEEYYESEEIYKAKIASFEETYGAFVNKKSINTFLEEIISIP